MCYLKKKEREMEEEVSFSLFLKDVSLLTWGFSTAHILQLNNYWIFMKENN